MKAPIVARTASNLIGERVRKARQSFSPPITQDQLSGRLARYGVEINRVKIAKIENGIRCVFDFEVRAFALVLKVDANWLLGISNDVDLGSRKKI